MHPSRNVLLMAALALTLSIGCEAIPSGAAAPAGGVRTSLLESGFRTGEFAADFRLPTPGGKMVTLGEFRGKPVLVNFWATWCGPCRIEMPDINAVYQESQSQGMVVLAVNVEEDGPTAKRFADDLRLTFPILLDETGEVIELYRVSSLPTTYFIDREGVIRDVAVGFMTRESLTKRLAKIL